MKNIKSIVSIVTLLVVTLFISSCKKGYFTDVNENPNQPTEVSPNVLLPSAEISIAYSIGGDGERFSSIFSQYITGGSRQFYSYNRYIMTEEDFNNYWNNMYAGGMNDLNKIIELSDAKPGKYTVYGGIARILMAYSLGTMTDQFGDIPYSQAFKGLSNLKPAYDSQQQIYTSIQNLLKQGADSLANDGGDDLLTPNAEDKIYKGNTSSWISLSFGLSARYALHLSKRDATAAQKALDAIAAQTAGFHDADYYFGSAYPNPWFQYIDQRDDILYDGYCIQTMLSKNDPRYGIYIDTADVYWGTGYIGPYYSVETSPIPLFTYYEQKFIEAEANARLNNLALAKSSMIAAISANMTKLGVASSDATTYLDSLPAFPGTVDSAVAYIMNEKYFSMYLQPESWVDFRRTGQPKLTPNDGVLTQIPRRFIYPTNERLYNSNGSNQGSTLLSPALWWDK